MESTSLVAHWFTLSVFCLASTELTEILGGAGDDVCEEEDFDAAKWLACFFFAIFI